MRSIHRTGRTMSGQGGMREAGAPAEELEGIALGEFAPVLPVSMVLLPSSMHSCMHSYMYPHIRRAGYGDLVLVLCRRATLALGWGKPCLPLTARAVLSVRRADRAIPAARSLLGSWSVRWAWGQGPAIVAMTCLPPRDPGPGPGKGGREIIT